MNQLVKNATIFYGGSYKREDLLISGGKIDQIRENILPKNGIAEIDGTDYCILPGFISSKKMDEQKAIEHGVTTRVADRAQMNEKEMDWLEKSISAEVELQDYTYRIQLESLDRKVIENLGSKGIKLIAVNHFPSDWGPWISRFGRLGLVLDLHGNQLKEGSYLPLPMVVPYSFTKKPVRSRMVVRVEESDMGSWMRSWRQMTPFTPASYWLDTIGIPCPNIHTSEELMLFLMLITHVSSRVPAKLLGIFPRKGCIHVGADADLLFFHEKSLIGSSKPLVPDKVMVKGQFVQNGSIHKKEYQGQFLAGNQTYAFQY